MLLELIARNQRLLLFDATNALQCCTICSRMRKAERDKGSKESDEKGVQRVQDINIDPKVLDCALTFCAVCRFEMVSHKPCQGFLDQWK